MSAIGVLQQSRESPSTLLLRFASLHSHISTTDGEYLEEESATYYQNEFDQDRLSVVKPRQNGRQHPTIPTIRAGDEIYQLRGLVPVEPLTIKKRKPGKDIAVHTTATRDRRASPRTPRLPCHPTSRPSHATLRPRCQPPSPSSAESLSPFTSLGYSFLNMVTTNPDTPLLPSLLATVDSQAAAPDFEITPPRKTSLPSSELHLGLGRFTIWDRDITPGPSPPGTPAVSPIKRTFSTTQIVTPSKQALRQTEPMTPSRAGSKAIQVLGTMDVSMKKFTSSSPEGPKVKKREHFRPLPSSVIRELDILFGRTSRSGKSGKQASSTDERSRTGKPLPAVPTSIDERKVGQGKIVNVTDCQGQVWQDLEEQAEFAWLLSEQGRGGPILLLLSPILSSDPSRSSPSASTPEADQRTPCGSIEADDVQVVDADNVNSDGDDPFGLPSWRSVYDVPKPHKAPFVLGTKAASTLGVSPGEAASRGIAFLATDPYAVKYAKGRQPSPEARHRPSPLKLAAAAEMKPVNTIAVQQDFVASSFSPISANAKAPQYDRSVSGQTAVNRASRASAYARPRLAPNPPPRAGSTPADRVVAVDSGMKSFMNAGTHAEMGGLAASMSKKVGGMFRRAS